MENRLSMLFPSANISADEDYFVRSLSVTAAGGINIILECGGLDTKAAVEIQEKIRRAEQISEVSVRAGESPAPEIIGNQGVRELQQPEIAEYSEPAESTAAPVVNTDITPEPSEENTEMLYGEGEEIEAEFEKRRRALMDQYMKENQDFKPVSNGSEKQKDPRQSKKKLKLSEGDELLFGKPVDRGVSKIESVAYDTGKVAVEGTVFASDYRRINSREAYIFTFDIYDGTGSVRIFKFFEGSQGKELSQEISSAIKEQRSVLVQGRTDLSERERSNLNYQIVPTAIILKPHKKRVDNAPEKRIELHLHTKMSAMDGLCDTKDIIRVAAEMGHSAIAITDHGVLQAYPEAMQAAKAMAKSGMPIKILYGVEAYCVNDIRHGSVVRGEPRERLDDEIIVFDLETTGLNPKHCEIIEIAAVLYKNGEILDKYHTYIKPKALIPPEITKLTGINNAIVADAPSLDEVLPGFLEFCGDRIMCAHNASFDISFMEEACKSLGINREFTSVDTVELSRALLPDMARHKLNNLAERFGIKFTHHRALDDTMALAEIFKNLMSILMEKTKVEYFLELNDAVDMMQGSESYRGSRSYHTIVFARNRQGLQDLYELVSNSHLKTFYRHPLIPMSKLKKKRENLIIGSACEAGELFSSIVSGKSYHDLLKIARFYDFLEIQPIGNNRFLIEKGLAKDDESLRDFNHMVVRLGAELKKPVCATGDVHFINMQDSIFRKILMKGVGFEDADNQAPLYYRTTEEMLEEFSWLGEERAKTVVIDNPRLIADMCEELQPILDGTYPPSVENSAQELEERTRSKVMELYSVDGVLPEIVEKRVNDELIPIIANGFDVMYMTAQKLVAKSMENGYLVGSRGSVGSSFVAYLSGITEVNSLPPHYVCRECKYSDFDVPSQYKTGVDMPDKVCPKCGEMLYKDGYNIPFATFLGFQGEKAPDIDLNFSGEYQAQAHRDTIELFGEDNVFKAGTIGTVKERTAYGFVMKYLEEKHIDACKAEENRLTLGCTGVKRTTGQHPGGLIVVPKDRSIYEFCPVQHPADKSESDIITTHFAYTAIHDNLLKLDLLGHDDPTMIHRLHKLTGIDPRTIPMDDKETMAIFTDISPLGISGDDILEQPGSAIIPEFGTKFVRGMLMETKPTTFDGLVRISGLSHGTDVWRNNAQDIIKDGHGKLKDVICCRDDITGYLMELGMPGVEAFEISEAVRKGKGLKADWSQKMKEYGVPDWYIKSCDTIKYLFPRAHAVAYVMMAFRIAWFKVHMPMAFYCAYFSVRAPGFDAQMMIFGDETVCKHYRELKAKQSRSATEEDVLITLEACHEFYKRGFSFKPVDLYISQARDFVMDGDYLIPPFSSVSGVGDTAADSIVNAREELSFSSVDDMLKRCPGLTKTGVEALEDMGTLKGIPKSDQLSMFDMLM